MMSRFPITIVSAVMMMQPQGKRVRLAAPQGWRRPPLSLLLSSLRIICYQESFGAEGQGVRQNNVHILILQETGDGGG